MSSKKKAKKVVEEEDEEEEKYEIKKKPVKKKAPLAKKKAPAPKREPGTARSDITPKHKGSHIHKIKGVLQSIIIPKSKFTEDEALRWVEEHDYIHTKVDETNNFYRFRQAKPQAGAHYYTLKLPNGIEFIHMDVKVSLKRGE